MTDDPNKIEQIVTHVWEDEDFKQELLSNPKAVIERESGEKLPEAVEVRVLQETPSTRYLALPSGNMTAKERQEVLQQLREGAAGEFSSLMIRSLEDNAFKQELLSQPNAVIERELGITLPEGADIRVVEQESNIRYLVLPWRPDLLEEGELSEEALEAIAGGWCLCSKSCGNSVQLY
jgi:hypothetical protein